jgi:hypothetical protein
VQKQSNDGEILRELIRMQEMYNKYQKNSDKQHFYPVRTHHIIPKIEYNWLSKKRLEYIIYEKNSLTKKSVRIVADRKSESVDDIDDLDLQITYFNDYQKNKEDIKERIEEAKEDIVDLFIEQESKIEPMH